VAYVVRHSVLRVAILLFSLYSAVVAPLVVALAVRITRDLAETDSVYGLVVAAFGVGGVLGSLTVARLGRRTNVVLVFLGGIAATGVVIVGVGLVDAIAGIVVLVVLGGLTESLVTVTYVTLRTASTPDVLLGRVASTARVTSLGLQPIGMITGGLLIDTIGGTATIVVIGLCACLLSLAFRPVRALRSATLAPAAPA
jgi:MFS family permease